MMHALTQVTVGTMKTEEAYVYFFLLNYCATNQDTSIIHYASDIIIRGYRDAVYLVALKSQSRNAGYIFIRNKDRNIQIINNLVLSLFLFLSPFLSWMLLLGLLYFLVAYCDNKNFVSCSQVSMEAD